RQVASMTQSAIHLCVALFGEFALKMRTDQLALSFFLVQMSCGPEAAEPPELSSDGAGGNYENDSAGGNGGAGAGASGGASFATGGQSISSSSGGNFESS